MTEEKKWYQKIDPFTVDRLVFLFLFISIALPYIQPIGLPIILTEKTLKFYEAVESIPAGGYILWYSGVNFGQYYLTVPGEIAFFRHVFTLSREKNLKFIFACESAATEIIVESIIMEYCAPFGYMEGLEYGVDYVNTGWLPGGEAVFHGLVTDFQGTVKTDYKGTPISELPITQDIKGGEDFDILGWSTSVLAEGFIRQWLPTGKPIIANIYAITSPTLDPYYEKGLIVSYLYDIRGASEYERLLGYSGMATVRIDCQSLTHLFGVAMIIVTAIYFASKRWMK